MNSRLIPGGQDLSKRQTVFFTSVDAMNKEHKDPDVIDLDAPRLAWYKQKTWKKQQDTVYWVDFNLAQLKGFKFYQTRSNAITLDDTLPAYCIPKAIMMGTGEITYEKVYASPRPPPKISFSRLLDEKNWVQKLLEVVKTPNKPNQRPKIQLVEQGDLFWQSNHPVRVPQEIENVSYLGAKAPMKEQGDLFSSCVPVSVERLDQDKRRRRKRGRRSCKNGEAL